MKNGKLIFLQPKYSESDNSNRANFYTLILILIIVKINPNQNRKYYYMIK